jgi:hypothetical protein
VAQWAKILHVTPSAVYKQLAKHEVRSRSTSGPQSRGKIIVGENRIRLAFPGRLQAKTGENRILTELFEKLDSLTDIVEAQDEALKVLLKRTEHLS